MPRRTFILAILFAAFLVAAAAHPALTASHGYQGAWYAKDPIDGSCLHMRIAQIGRSGERVFSIQEVDSDASDWCQGKSRQQGLGVLDHQGLLVTTAVHWCMPNANEVRYFQSGSFSYDPSADTITDSAGTVYQRERLLIR